MEHSPHNMLHTIAKPTIGIASIRGVFWRNNEALTLRFQTREGPKCTHLNAHNPESKDTPMKYRSIAFLAFTIQFTCSIAWAFRLPPNPDVVSLYFEPNLVDLAVLEAGVPVEREINLINSTPSDVRILATDTSCGCAMPEFKVPFTVPASSNAKLSIIVHPKTSGPWQAVIGCSFDNGKGQLKKTHAILRGRVTSAHLDNSLTPIPDPISEIGLP